MKIHRDGKPIPSNTVISPRWNGGGLQIINNEFNIQSIVGMLTQQVKGALGISQPIDVVEIKHSSKYPSLNTFVLVSRSC